MELMNYVRMLEGRSDVERKNIIINVLKEKKFDFRTEKYSHWGFQGENIIIDSKIGEKKILAVTHYDVVGGSPGANDNASTIAVMFDVLEKLKKYRAGNSIRMIIFDQEEIGCIGSRAYVKKHGIEDILAVYNMELVGMGDMIGIWPVAKDVDDSIALKVLRDTIGELGYYHEESGKLPLFFGDYLPFREAGVKDSFCISVVDRKDKDAVRKFVEMPKIFLIPKFWLGMLKVPKMFRYYHSSEDKSIHLDESALQMTSDVLYNAIVNMDSG